jgi:ribosomal protein S18 acetylase RimI-like enzyme
VVVVGQEQDERVLGSVQLHLEVRPNGRHRAEVAKLMVHPDARRRGIGRQLMRALETVALRERRTLLVLDTREGDPSNALYASLGYVEVGRIPRYARSASGRLDASVFYYKEL